MTNNGSYYSVRGKYDDIIIVNKKHGLSKDYNPGENPTAKAAFVRLRDDMINQGLNVGRSYSGFRSYDYQKTLYDNYVSRDGQAAADRYSARPGFSEHQTGLVFDLTDKSGNLLEDARASQWLKDNAHNYGFIVRFQAGKEASTGYMPEAWHIRYVGKEAKDIHDSGLSLEEYFGIEGGDYAASSKPATTGAINLPATGTYTFTGRASIKAEAKVSSPELAYYDKGMSVNYDKVLTADGHQWLSYVTASGARRYVDIAAAKSEAKPEVKPVAKPADKPSLPESGTYTFTGRASIKAEAKVSSPELAYYDKGMSVNYDKVLTADGRQWLSYVTASGARRYVDIAAAKAEAKPEVKPVAKPADKPNLPESGTYTFTGRASIKAEAKVSSPELAYYDKGMTVNYDKVLTADGRQWLSYVTASGARRYVDIAAAKTETKPEVSQPAAKPSLPESGTYTFTGRASIKAEAKVSSPELAYYDKGMSVNYDKVLTADGHQWLSYMTASGARRYVDIATVKATETKPEVKPVAKPADQPSLPESGTYTFTSRASIKAEAKVSSPELAYYDKGMSVNYDKVLTADGRQWLSYMTTSGARRYVDIAAAKAESKPASQPEVKPVAKPADKPSLPESGTYTFTGRASIKAEAKVSSPELAYYDKGMSVNYDKVLTADGRQWLSYVTASGARRYVDIAAAKAEAKPEVKPVAKPADKPNLPESGTYTFTGRASIKAEAKVSSPELAYYDKGMTVNYDKVLTADGRQWLSYVTASGARRYVDIAAAKTETKPEVSQPAAKPSLPESGTYTFTGRASIKAEAKVSSPELAYYDKGMSVNYDKVLTADGHQWLSYMTASGARRYVDIATVKATETKPEVKPVAKPADQPSLPESGTYTFTSRASIKAEAKVSSPELAYYDKGMSVNYDKVLTADGRQWLSYVTTSGARRYVEIAAAKAEAKPETKPVAKPADKPSLPESGRYTFTGRASIKAEAKVSSPELAYYDKGMSVNYDKVLTADGHTWLSYMTVSGARRYVDIA